MCDVISVSLKPAELHKENLSKTKTRTGYGSSVVEPLPSMYRDLVQSPGAAGETMKKEIEKKR